LHNLVLVSVVGELRQDTVTGPKQFLQMLGFFHDGRFATVRLLKTESFRQTLYKAQDRPRPLVLWLSALTS